MYKDLPILKTPKDRLNFLMLSAFIYVSAPIFEWLNLQDLVASGKLPANADSLGLPMGLFIIDWVVFAPIGLALTIWVLQNTRHKFRS